MTRMEKLVKRFCSIPGDLTFEELVAVMSHFGYEVSTPGKTSGSRIRFCKEGSLPIFMHKPHPKNVVGKKVIGAIVGRLKEEGLL